MEYLSISQMAEKWGISRRRIQVLCSENRIEGAVRIGFAWAIPMDAKKPADGRIRSGKYRKKQEPGKENDKSKVGFGRSVCSM